MVKKLLSFLIILALFGCKGEREVKQNIPGKKVLMVIASSNFRDEEYQEPRQILEGAGAEITVASLSLNPARGTLGATVKPDIRITEVNVADYDAILFIGGSGSREYFSNPAAHSIARQAVEGGKILGGICSACSTLANAGVLAGKRATAFSSEGPNLKAKGANYTGADLEIDGKIITANGPQAAAKFGRAILEALREE